MSLDNAKRSRPLDQPPPASSRKATRTKPAKPYPDFPLFPHATGRWAKKIRGKFVFFGPWDDPYGALERYTSQRDALHAGLVPRPAATGTFEIKRTAGSAGATAVSREQRRVRTVLAPNSALRPGSTGVPSPVTGVSAEVRERMDTVTLRELVNRFLTAKQRRVETGEMRARSLQDYFYSASLMIEALGKDRRVDDITQNDFGRLRSHLAEGRGPIALGIHIQKVRSIFKFGFDSGLLDRPVRFGPEFDKPTRTAIRHARNARPARMFEPAEIKTILASAGVQMRAMVLLGLNAGMGNNDVASLPKAALNLDAAVLEFPRPKTAIPRRAALWPETVGALRQALKVRPEPKEPEAQPLVFVTKYGKAWVRTRAPGARAKVKSAAVSVDSINLEFGKLIRELGLARLGRSFYALRHTFRTIADEVGDRPAVDLVMGHQDGGDIATHYVERISDDRLRKVADYVRAWLGTIAP
ncbi:MAG: hypothetical protein L6Q35_10255 [Phycisphaerales bacterium]|nr:hypothetical protein [Phycisphaerales bacterium]